MDQQQQEYDIKKWEILFDPLPSQQEFVECEARFKGFSGPVGSGKSMALLLHGAKAGDGERGMPGPARRTDVSNDEGRDAGCVSADAG